MLDFWSLPLTPYSPNSLVKRHSHAHARSRSFEGSVAEVEEFKVHLLLS